MIKVQVLGRCDMCGGEAYVAVGEAESNSGEPYTRYAPCPYCEGAGNRAKWISLQEFADLLEVPTQGFAIPIENAGAIP